MSIRHDERSFTRTEEMNNLSYVNRIIDRQLSPDFRCECTSINNQDESAATHGSAAPDHHNYFDPDRADRILVTGPVRTIFFQLSRTHVPISLNEKTKYF